MRNEERRKKLKKLLIVLGIIVLIGALLFLGFELIKSSKLTNFEVKVNNLGCTDKDQITKFLQNLNQNYFSFKQEGLTADLKKKFFCIGKIETEIFYPDRLILEVWGREPLFAVNEINESINVNPVVLLPEAMQEASESTKEAAAVKVIDEVLKDLEQASGSAVFLVDREGVIFEQLLGSINFPRISIFGIKIEIGGKIPDGIIEKIESVGNKLKEINAPTDNIIVVGDRLIINSKPRIIFSLDKKLDYQTASLQLILAQAKINSDPPKTGSGIIESIDLRFDKPVVVYTSKR